MVFRIALKPILLSAMIMIGMLALASSQGYMGTVSTGTGIVSPVAVGKGTATPAEIGGLSGQSNLTGNWSLDLRGTQSRHIDLEVFQSGELILGTGQISSGGSTLNATLAGEAAGESLKLFISPLELERAEVFRLQLSISGGSFAGKYEALSQGGVIEPGTVTGNVVFSAAQGKEVTVISRESALPATAPSSAGAAKTSEAESLLNSLNSLNSSGSSGSSVHTIEKSVFKSSNGQSITTGDGSSVLTTDDALLTANYS